MAPRTGSRHSFALGVPDELGRRFLSEREPYRFREHTDTRVHVVAQGDTIGAVGRTGPTSNNHPHLHFELAIDADGDGAASWGFEGAERVIPWFDGVEYGQANAMTWRDVVSNNCP